jgi:hypothetical protein
MLKEYSSTQLIRELLHRGYSISHFKKNYSIESLNHDGNPPYLVSTDLYSEYDGASAFSDAADAVEALYKKEGLWSPDQAEEIKENSND